MKFINLLESLWDKVNKKGNGKKSPDGLLTFDLLYLLSYMSVISAAGVPRDLVFARTAQLPCPTARYFNKIEVSVQKLKYDYTKACRLVGENASEQGIKELLLRFSSSLLSGEPEAEFLAREAEAHASYYESEYGGKLETLKLWTDAYVSLILSAVLIIIMGVVSTLIWKMAMSFIFGLTTVAIMSTLLGVWLIYLMSPREVTVLPSPSSKEQKLTRKLFEVLIPLAAVVSALLLLAGMGWSLIAIGLMIFPVGYMSTLDDNKVINRDREIGAFLRSLGGVAGAVGTTVRDALRRIDVESLSHLKEEVKRLNTRLTTGIRARLCWQRFVEDTGSELTSRSVGMFYEAVDLGGGAEEAGHQASLFASRVALLRTKRKTVSSPFRWLCIAMHAAVVLLLVFITEVMAIFGEMIYESQTEMPTLMEGSSAVTSVGSFNFEGLELMHALVIPLLLIFTVANALAPSIADGGSRYKIFYNLGITSFITGLALVSLPVMAASLFQAIRM